MIRTWYNELSNRYYDFLMWSASSKRNATFFVLLATLLLSGFLIIMNRGGSYPGPLK